MNILFENVTEYNRNEIEKFQDFHAKKNIPYAIYLILLLILLIITLIVNIAKLNMRLILGCAFWGGLLFIYYKFFKKERDRVNNIKVTDKKFKFDFYDRYLTATEVNNKTKEHATTNYFEIKKVYETEENFYLYMNATYSLVINKNNFTIGDPTKFREFIKKKCLFKYRKVYTLKKRTKKLENTPKSSGLKGKKTSNKTKRK